MKTIPLPPTFNPARPITVYLDKASIAASVPAEIISRLASHGALSPQAAVDKYFAWIDGRADDYSSRTEDFVSFGSKMYIRAWLHSAVINSNGACFYTKQALEWEHAGTKLWDAIYAPSIDHDRESGQLEYRLTYIRLNRSKQDMTIAEWLELTDLVKLHQPAIRP